MSEAMETLGLMKVQLEDGAVHTVPEAIQVVMDYLMVLAESGDARAVRCAMLLGGVDISVAEFATALSRVPGLVDLCKQARQKACNGTLRLSEASYLPGVVGAGGHWH
jgi:hypothetical protein